MIGNKVCHLFYNVAIYNYASLRVPYELSFIIPRF